MGGSTELKLRTHIACIFGVCDVTVCLTSFYRKMFGWYDDPFFWGMRPARYYYQPRHSFVDRYLASVERRLAQLLDEELDYPGYSIDVDRKAQQLQHQMDKDAADHSEAKEKARAEARAQYNDEPEPAKPAPVRRPAPTPFSSYFYESRSSFNGRDRVEEHREKVTDQDGLVHTTLRRRLGDRWYEVESHTDKDGRNTSKETWHNVPEEQIEAFKKEWSEKHGEKYAALGSETPAVEDKSGDKKGEEEKKTEA